MSSISFGSRIKSLRKSHKFTQQHLASLIHIDRSFLSYLENDLKKPSLFVAVELARAFEIDISKLIENVELLPRGTYE